MTVRSKLIILSVTQFIAAVVFMASGFASLSYWSAVNGQVLSHGKFYRWPPWPDLPSLKVASYALFGLSLLYLYGSSWYAARLKGEPFWTKQYK